MGSEWWTVLVAGQLSSGILCDPMKEKPCAAVKVCVLSKPLLV